MTRRAALQSVAAAPLIFGLRRTLAANSAYRFVVIGGGYAGSRFARELKQLAPEVEIVLIERSTHYSPCPMANLSLLSDQEVSLAHYDYRRLKALGVVLLHAEVLDVEPGLKTIHLVNGQRLHYDALLVAPGISFREEAIEGFGPEVAEQMPHAWTSGQDIQRLARQLRAMPDNGRVLVAVPPGPIRCPPAPYERATLIARYLKQWKPRAKVRILDSNHRFSLQPEFEACWQSELSGYIERQGPDDEGRIIAVDIGSRTLLSDFEQYHADVISLIPHQKAGALAEKIGLTDGTGWCPVDPSTFASHLLPDTYVLGDAALLTPMPKSAAAGIDQAEQCARAWVNTYRGRTNEAPIFENQCFAFVHRSQAHALKGSYRAADGHIVMNEMIKTGQVGDPESLAATAGKATAWFERSAEVCFA
ncbi:MAG: FAD-dependent oxidoreductase [Pseudomonadales bacterium]